MSTKAVKDATILMLLAVPCVIVTLVTGLAILRGITHPWLVSVFLLFLVLEGLFALLMSSTCAVLNEKYLKIQIERDDLSVANRKINSDMISLRDDVHHLTYLREIYMCSQLENFSDLMLNMMGLLMDSSDMRSVAIYKEMVSKEESHLSLKACLYQVSLGDIKGKLFFFFEDIAMNENDTTLGGFSVEDLQFSLEDIRMGLSGHCLLKGEMVGVVTFYSENRAALESEETTETVSKLIEGIQIECDLVQKCWNNRNINSKFSLSGTHVSIVSPIVVQRLCTGVLAADMPTQSEIESAHHQIEKQKSMISDYAQIIGNPLRRVELLEMTIRDAMTKLYNKKHFETQLNECFRQMLRYKREMSVIFIDLDHFKFVNDTYGHQTGDIVLIDAASIILKNIRKADMAFRYGGEELVVLLVETEGRDAAEVAEKLRRRIESHKFITTEGDELHRTASFGVAQLHHDMKSSSELLQMADEAVYEAKNGGRNRVILKTRTSDGSTESRQITPESPLSPKAST